MQTEIGERLKIFRLHMSVRILHQKMCLKLLYGKKDK
jgi:hypothetical protein